MFYKWTIKSEYVSLIMTNTVFCLKLTTINTIETNVNVLYREVYLTSEDVIKYWQFYSILLNKLFKKREKYCKTIDCIN